VKLKYVAAANANEMLMVPSRFGLIVATPIGKLVLIHYTQLLE